MKGLEVSFLMEHAKEPARLLSEDDVDAFIDSLMRGPHVRNCAVVYSLDRPALTSGYRDHELAVGIDNVEQIGTISLAADANYASRGSVDRGVLEYDLLGHVREFMPGSEISVDLIRRAVKEFLLSGGQIPTCIEWQEEQF